jgi:hypothetical protein
MSKQFEELYAKADAAGRAAVEKATVIPMVVGTATSLFGNEIDRSKPTYFVEGGPCGFSWVNLKPGNCKFANWLKATRRARTDSYYGGVTIWVSEYGQSMQRKEAYATAFAEVIREAGVAKSVYAQSRMD